MEENSNPKDAPSGEPANTPEPQVDPPRPPGGAIGLFFSKVIYVFHFIWSSLWQLTMNVINLKSTTDIPGTINSIKAGIVIKGYNIWILIASAVLACVGLDTNSVAVVIGAMLISPLMSPILGIGLAIGINDRLTLRNSLYNFSIAVAVSLLTATIYFLVTPLGRVNEQILARTVPTILDVVIGFFGGVAGIIAGSRTDKTNAIPGVAIATALMPPLCVAGFGLATANINFFAGAFYLFFLNSVFISLSTFLIVRYLKFPWKEKITGNLARNFTRGVTLFVILLVVPSVMLFIEVIQLQNRQSKIEEFLSDKFGRDRIEFSVEKQEYIETDSVNYLRVTVASSTFLPKDTVELYKKEVVSKYGLNNTVLKLFQNSPDPNDRQQILEQARTERQQELADFKRDRELAFERQYEIEALKKEIQRIKAGEIPILEIRDDIRDMCPELASVSFGYLRAADMKDATARMNPNSDKREFTLRCTWGDSLPLAKAEDRKSILRERLRNKYSLQNVRFEDLNAPFIQESDGGN